MKLSIQEKAYGLVSAITFGLTRIGGQQHIDEAFIKETQDTGLYGGLGVLTAGIGYSVAERLCKDSDKLKLVKESIKVGIPAIGYGICLAVDPSQAGNFGWGAGIAYALPKIADAYKKGMNLENN